MIFTDFLKALAQFSDRRFRRVIWLGIALSLLLLFGVYAGFLLLINSLVGSEITLPVIGEVTHVRELLGFASLFFMLFLSIFLMVPVASLFTGLFLDDVADAVENRHYSRLPAVSRRGFFAGFRQSLKFFGVLILANLLALILYLLLPFAAPLIWVALNGYLLSREFFIMVAERRVGSGPADELRRFHWLEIWFAGCLMTAPLMIPVLNLLVPVLGVATFTHLYHRLPRR